ncbi:MAG TPA: hypothetical protein VIF57_09755 [Polyangia bacterium]|jgi:hypothetical protein
MSVSPRALFLAVPCVVLAGLVPGRAAAQAIAPPAAAATQPPPPPAEMPPPTVAPIPAPVPQLADEPPPPPAPPTDAEAALRRVLRSGCRDGLAEVRAHAADPGTPWAPTVARLCDGILGQQLQEETRARTVHGGNEGRGRLVLWSSLYGIWLGIAVDVLFEIDSQRAVIVPPLLGLGAGLGISLAATRNYELTVGEAWTIITGLDYGTINGALWAGGLDFSDKGVVGAAVATGIAATSIGVLVADAKSPSAGDIELVRSGLLWGTIGGFLATIAIAPHAETRNALKAVAASMDAGFVVAVGLANSFDLSRNRVLIIDAGALAGGLMGAGVAWLIAGTNNNARGLAGAALGGLVAGIGVAAYATRNLDGQDAAVAAAPAVPAALARDRAGRWRLGTPGPVPVLDGTGTRLIGATFNALGGEF